MAAIEPEWWNGRQQRRKPDWYFGNRCSNTAWTRIILITEAQEMRAGVRRVLIDGVVSPDISPVRFRKIPVVGTQKDGEEFSAGHADCQIAVVGGAIKTFFDGIAPDPKDDTYDNRQSHNGPPEPESHDESITIPKVRQFERGEGRLDMDMEGFCLMVRR